MNIEYIYIGLLSSILVGVVACVILLCMVLWRNNLLKQAYTTINDFVQMSLAHMSSRDINPATGPAILQKLADIKKTSPENKELINLQGTLAKESPSGIRITRG